MPDNSTDDRTIAIDAVGPPQSTVVVGQTLRGVSVNRRINTQPDTSYSLWQIEPAGAARIVQAMPIKPAGNTVDIEFLQATTVTVRIKGFEEATEPLYTDALLSDSAGDNVVEYTYTVLAADTTQNASATTSLNSNQRAARQALELACVALSNNQGGNTASQNALLSTCDESVLQSDPSASFDHIAAEELFALGDALTVSADQQISNIQSRLNTIRAGQRQGFDINALSVQLWDQPINARVLSASQQALTKHTGGSASQDVIRESALGVFANGNLSIGSIDGRGNQRDADISTNSLTIGADYRMNNHRVVGAAVGIVNDKTDFIGDHGNMDMQGFSLTAFGTWYELDKGYADILFEAGQNDFNLKRRISLPGQTTEFANSNTHANRMVLSISAGRTFQRGVTEFGPAIRIAITKADIDGFSEKSSLAGSGNGTELDVKSHSLSSVRFSIGGEVKRVINLTRSVLLPTLRLEFESESQTDKGAIRASFVHDPDNNTMQFTGAQRSSRALLVNAGLTAVLMHGRSAFVSLETRAMDDHVSQSRVRLGYRMNF